MSEGSSVLRPVDARVLLSRWLRAVVLVAVLGLAAPWVGVARAAPPTNDVPSGATPITVNWTGVTEPQPQVPVSSWSAASSPVGDPLTTSCSGATSAGTTSLYSMWWSVSVAEPSMLTTSVLSGNVASFLPVVSVYDSANKEQSCAVADSDPKANGGATAVTYVYPNADGSAQTYYIRVAEAFAQSQTARPPYTLYVSGKDMTAPRVLITMPKDVARLPGPALTYDATPSRDIGSGIDTATAVWTFRDGYGPVDTQTGTLTATHKWKTPGLHRVVFSVKDHAGNETSYTFFAFVHDFQAPRIRQFGAVSVPFPGGRYLRIVVKHDEPITLRVVVTQGTRLLFRSNMRLLKGTQTTRRLHLHSKVRRAPWITVAGSAKDSAGNVTVLPSCQLDPVSGKGRCFLP